MVCRPHRQPVGFDLGMGDYSELASNRVFKELFRKSIQPNLIDILDTRLYRMEETALKIV